MARKEAELLLLISKAVISNVIESDILARVKPNFLTI
jgi:hypothetical protein